MNRSIASSLLALAPAVVLLSYLALRATEGWQLLIVGAFALGFLASWLRHSRTLLVASYLAAAALAAWVLSVNL